MRTLIKTFSMGICALVLAAIAQPGAAQSPYPCSNAPGERVVGMTNSGGVTVPLCVQDGPPQPPPPPVTTHAALAWHPDASDVWVDGNWNGPNHGAREGALAMCARVMGEGCVVGAVWNDSSQQIYRDNRGGLWVAWTYDKSDVARVEAECQGKTVLPCEKVVKIHSSYDRDPGPEVRKRYLGSAWVADVKQDDGKLYIASGESSLAAAQTKAMAACSAANPGTTCELAAWTGDGHLQTYFLGDRAVSTAHTSSKRAAQAAKAICKREKAKSCTLLKQYDARRPGQFVHDFKAGGKGG